MIPQANPMLQFGGAPVASAQSGSAAALIVLALLLIVAVYGEVKENRIPNWLTLTGMASGLLIGYLYGERAFWLHLGGLIIGFGFLFIFYIFGGIGGGDVKLMGAVGALMGADLIKPTLFYTAAIGALLAILIVVWRKDFWARASWNLRRLVFWKKPTSERPAKASPITVPYGIAIAVGCLATLLLT
jgi:prepilin peptidase CpaA